MSYMEEKESLVKIRDMLQNTFPEKKKNSLIIIINMYLCKVNRHSPSFGIGIRND